MTMLRPCLLSKDERPVVLHGPCRMCSEMQTSSMLHYIDRSGKVVCKDCAVAYVIAGEEA